MQKYTKRQCFCIRLGIELRTPQRIIERLNRELAAILQMPDIQEAARAESSTINGGTPQDLQKFLKSEVAKFAKLVNEARIKTDARN